MFRTLSTKGFADRLPRLRNLIVLPAAAAVVLLGISLAAAAPFRLILTHLEPPLVPNSVMDLALEKGYFANEGVEVELIRVEQTPSALAAIQAGEGEMANVGVDGLLLLVANGATDLKAVTSPNKSLPYVIAAKDEIKTVADLSGRIFGVGRVGSLDHSLSMKVLSSEGLDTSTMDVLAIGQPNVRAQALVAGQIDATTMSIGVWLSIPDKTGYHLLVEQERYYAAVPVINKVNVVTQKVLDERGADVEAVIRALIKISRDFATDPDAWAAAMVPYAPNTDEAGLQSLAATFAGSWSVNGGMDRGALQFTQDYLYTTEDFANIAPMTVDQWADFGPVDAALADARYRRKPGSRRPMKGERSQGEDDEGERSTRTAVPAVELDGIGVSFRSARLKSEIVALKDVTLSVEHEDLRHRPRAVRLRQDHAAPDHRRLDRAGHGQRQSSWRGAQARA